MPRLHRSTITARFISLLVAVMLMCPPLALAKTLAPVATGTAARETAASSLSTPGTFTVGYHLFHFTYRTPPWGFPKTVTTSVWYPTAAQPALYSYNRTLPGVVALDAPVLKLDSTTRWPLLVYSHGLWGCATASTVITQNLAAHGYIVVAPEHDDQYFCSAEGIQKPWMPWIDFSKPEIQRYPNRPGDITATITEMLAQNQRSDSTFFQTIDPSLIGVLGHSLGAWTALVVSGAVPSYRDPRVKATLALEAGIEKDVPDFYTNVAVPVMYQIGEYSRYSLFPFRPMRVVYDSTQQTPKFLAIVKDADHMAFDDTICQPYVPRTIENCTASSVPAQTMIAYGAAFFDFILKHDVSAQSRLVMSPTLFEYAQDLGQ